MAKKNELEIEDKKYWIKEGMAVSHVDNPGLKMRVEKILRQTKTISIGDKTQKTTFLLGVKCHWFDKDNTIQRQVFNTRELIKYED